MTSPRTCCLEWVIRGGSLEAKSPWDLAMKSLRLGPGDQNPGILCIGRKRKRGVSLSSDSLKQDSEADAGTRLDKKEEHAKNPSEA